MADSISKITVGVSPGLLGIQRGTVVFELEAEAAGTEWESPYQASSPKTERQKQRRAEQADATECGLEWVPESPHDLPPPVVENAGTCPVLVSTVRTISRQWAPLAASATVGVPPPAPTRALHGYAPLAHAPRGVG